MHPKILTSVLILFLLLTVSSCQIFPFVDSRDRDWFEFGTPLRSTSTFELWAMGDAHLLTELANGYRSLESSLLDSLGGDEGGESFFWDIAINPGDYSAGQDCPATKNGNAVINQFRSSGVERSRIYSVPGNHDSGTRDFSWFNQYVDPMGENTEVSGVDNAKRPFDVTGETSHYSFQVGNILFLMIGDENFGGLPFGRACDGGYPAGRYSKETYDWWVSQVEANQDKIIITVAHHALFETTIYTGMNEGADQNIHGALTWADARGSSFIYAIGNWTIDGFDENQQPIGERPYGFKKYLKEHPGAIDLWLHGHTHHTLYPGKEFNGRTDIEFVDGVWFINSGALAKYHGAPEAPFSRLFEFTQDSNQLRMRTYMHSTGWGDVSEGFYAPAARTFELNKTFRFP